MSLKFFDNNKQGNKNNILPGYSTAAVQLELGWGGIRGALKTMLKMHVVVANHSLSHQEEAALVISCLFQTAIQKVQEQKV